MKPDRDVDLPVCEVKLWGDKVDSMLPTPDTSIVVTNVEMKNYLGKMDGNSTKLTEIKASTGCSQGKNQILKDGLNFIAWAQMLTFWIKLCF